MSIIDTIKGRIFGPRPEHMPVTRKRTPEEALEASVQLGQEMRFKFKTGLDMHNLENEEQRQALRDFINSDEEREEMAASRAFSSGPEARERIIRISAKVGAELDLDR